MKMRKKFTEEELNLLKNLVLHELEFTKTTIDSLTEQFQDGEIEEVLYNCGVDTLKSQKKVETSILKKLNKQLNKYNKGEE